MDSYSFKLTVFVSFHNSMSVHTHGITSKGRVLRTHGPTVRTDVIHLHGDGNVKVGRPLTISTESGLNKVSVFFKTTDVPFTSTN